MKPWGPSWLKLQTEFYPTGFLQARVRQSREGERASASGREGVVCVCVQARRAALAPPTPDSPREPERDTDSAESRSHGRII